MRVERFLFERFLTPLLIISLGVGPSSAYGLRTMELAENPRLREALTAGLEQESQDPQWQRMHQKIIDAIRGYLGGLLITKELAKLAGVSVPTLHRHNYRSLVSAENLRRKEMKRPRPAIELQVKDPKTEIMTALLQHPGGRLTTAELAELAGVGVLTLYNHSYRSLVKSENLRRSKMKRPRPAIKLRVEDPETAIVTALRQHPGGRLTVRKLAKLAGVGVLTLYNHNYRSLVKAENLRRSKMKRHLPAIEVQDPSRPLATAGMEQKRFGMGSREFKMLVSGYLYQNGTQNAVEATIQLVWSRGPIVDPEQLASGNIVVYPNRVELIKMILEDANLGDLEISDGLKLLHELVNASANASLILKGGYLVPVVAIAEDQGRGDDYRESAGKIARVVLGHERWGGEESTLRPSAQEVDGAGKLAEAIADETNGWNPLVRDSANAMLEEEDMVNDGLWLDAAQISIARVDPYRYRFLEEWGAIDVELDSEGVDEGQVLNLLSITPIPQGSDQKGYLTDPFTVHVHGLDIPSFGPHSAQAQLYVEVTPGQIRLIFETNSQEEMLDQIPSILVITSALAPGAIEGLASAGLEQGVKLGFGPQVPDLRLGLQSSFPRPVPSNPGPVSSAAGMEQERVSDPLDSEKLRGKRRLLLTRERLGLNQTKFGELLGQAGYKEDGSSVPASTISSWESEKAGSPRVPEAVLDLLPRIYTEQAPGYLRRSRKRLGLSQAEFGDALGQVGYKDGRPVSHGTISRWESEKAWSPDVPEAVLDLLPKIYTEQAPGYLRRTRERLGLTQAEFGELLGQVGYRNGRPVLPTTISSWESEKAGSRRVPEAVLDLLPRLPEAADALESDFAGAMPESAAGMEQDRGAGEERQGEREVHLGLPSSRFPRLLPPHAAELEQIEKIVQVLRAQRQGISLLGISPSRMESVGPELLALFERLKGQLAHWNPFLVLIGEKASQYEKHPAVLFTVENLDGAAVTLTLLEAGRMDYLASEDETLELQETLRRWGVPIQLDRLSMEELPAVLKQLLGALAGLDPGLSQSEVEAHYGVRLNELAEQLEGLVGIGV